MTRLVSHGLEPFYDRDSRVLILGSMPSPASRASGFYYGHPSNRFWPVLASVFGEEVPQGVEGRKDLLRRRGLALWDVLASCRIDGADDSSVRDPVANDLALVLREAPIGAIFTTGALAARLYRRLLLPAAGREAAALPSTSPANAAWDLERLARA